MKKTNFKKAMSLFMAVMMLLSCWVWVAPERAKAASVRNIPAINGSAYAPSDGTNAYETPVFDGNLDRWFKFQNGNDYTTIYYPSHIYLDKIESLEAAGYYFNVDWHFGGTAKYRILLGANIWGDHSQWPNNVAGDQLKRYRTMNEIFSNYAVDSSLPSGVTDGGVYGRTASATNYDLRIVGYGYSDQGSDGFGNNGTRHDKYILYRSNNSNDPNTATIYLKGNPSESYVGKTTEYNTSGSSFGSYGLAQNYGSSWGTHSNGNKQFQSKGSDSSYKEGEWIEMQWFVTIYDKQPLSEIIQKAARVYELNASHGEFIEQTGLQTYLAQKAAAETLLITREITQSDINTQVTALENAIKGMKFYASNDALKVAINSANAIKNASDYTTKYTVASRQAFETALTAATNSKYAESVPVYQITDLTDSSKWDWDDYAYNDQIAINNLTNALNAAVVNLKNQYKITFVNFVGNTVSADYWAEGTTPTAPNNTAAYNDVNGHHTFTWPTISTVTGNATYKEERATGNHTEETIVGTPATCTTPGKTDGKKCTVCGTITVAQTDIPAKEHTEVADAEVEATCEAPGKTAGLHCSVCGEILVAQQEVPALGHNYDTDGDGVVEDEDGVLDPAPTCTDEGVLTFTCKTCGDKKTKAVSAKGHTEVTVPAVEATCTSTGLTLGTKCSVCDAVIKAQETVPMKDHTPGEETQENKKDPTCITAGSYEAVVKCTVCSTEISRETKTIAATGVHVYGDWAQYGDKHRRTCTNDTLCTAFEEESHNFTGTPVHVQGEWHHYKCEKCDAYGANGALNAKEACYGEGVEYIEIEGNLNNHTAKCKCGNTKTVAHNWVEDAENRVDATCTADGKAFYDCPQCQAEKTETLTKTGHSFKNYVSDGNATCTKDGTKTATCDNGCGVKDTVEDEGSMLDHEYTYLSTNDGKHDVGCENCGLSETEDCADAENDGDCLCDKCGYEMTHKWGDWKNADDNANHVRTCSECDKTETEDHKMSEVVTDPTCTKGGYTTHTCTVCTYSYTDTETDAKGHDWDNWTEVSAATCLAEGSEKRICQRKDCGAEETKAVAKLAHSYTGTIKSDGNGKDATHSFKCVNGCNEYGAAVAHTWDKGFENPEADCENAGTMTYTCTAEGCGATYTESVNPDGHTYGEWVEEDPATCTEEGTKGHYECNVCHKYFDAEKNVIADLTIPALEHKWGNWEFVADGQHKRVCENDPSHTEIEDCADSDDNNCLCDVCDELVAHTPAEAVKENIENETCGKDGSYESVVYCSVCDAELSRKTETVPATGKHNYGSFAHVANTSTHAKVCSVCGDTVTENCTAGDWVIDKTATCVETGSQYKACTVCTHEMEREEIPMIAHNFSGEAVNKEDGKHHYACQNILDTEGKKCGTYGAVVDGEHKAGETEACTYSEWIETKAPTCTEKGEKAHTCTVCNNTVTEEVDPINHNWDEGKITKEPTCTEKGVKTYTCQNNSDHTYTEEVEEKGHDWADADCTKPSTCKTCGETSGDAIGHSFTVYVETIDYTCTEDGYDVYKCLRCEETEHQNITSAAHRPEADYTVMQKATCESDGYKAVLCSVCAEELEKETITKREHKYVDNGVQTAATCKAEGVMNTICSNAETDTHEACTHESTRVIPADPDAHKEEAEYIETVAPTCSAVGEEKLYCEYCDEVLDTRDVAIDEDAHKAEAEYIETIAPTCSAVGEEKLYCEYCDEVLDTRDVAIDEDAHKAEAEYIQTVAPTCSAVGEEKLYCEYCDEVLDTRDVAIDEDAHKAEAEYIQTVAPTCSAVGEEKLYCEYCDEVLDTRDVAIDDDAHKWETEYTVDVEESCETDGSKSYHCEYCDAINEESKVVIPATDHDYDTTKSEANLTRPIKNADGTWTDGYYTFTCKNDADHKTTEPVKRADYTEYAAAVKNLEDLLKTDLTEEAKKAIEDAITTNSIKDNLIETEQAEVKNAADALNEVFEENKGDLKSYTVTFVIDGVEKKVTVISGNDATAPTDVKKAPDADYHYTFTGWDEEFTNVTDNITVTAQFNSVGHSFDSHADKDDTYHTDKCACGYEKDVEHSYDDGVVTTAPNCTEKGEKTFTCSICSGTRTEEIEANNHSYDDVWTAADEAGKHYRDCKVCAEKGRETVACTESETWVVSTNATCQEKGEEYKYCTVCSRTDLRTQEIPTIAHKFDVDVRFAGEGKHEFKCSILLNSGLYCDEYGAAEDCADSATDSDCNCDKCGTLVAHTEEAIPAVAATCTETGLTAGVKCSVCGETLTAQEEVPALGHTDEEIPAVAATCTETGLTAGVKCSVCGETLTAQETVPALGHTDEEIPAVAATCTETGLTAGVKCSVCGETLTAQETVPALGHTDEEIPAVDATCTETGLTAGVKCSVCDEILTAQEEIPALGHDYESVVTAPTCTKGGYTTYTCSRCGDSYVADEVEATDHTPAEAVKENENAATCTTGGSYESVVYCSDCGTELSRETITVPAADHTPGEAVTENIVGATCGQEGSYDSVVYCSACGTELSRETVTSAAVPHIPGAPVTENTVDSTCFKEGSYDIVTFCKVCYEEVSRETVVIPVKEHTPAKTVTENKVAATCVRNGSYDSVVYCSKCFFEISREKVVVSATGHKTDKPVVEDRVEANCTKDGSYNTVIYCVTCGARTSVVTTVLPALGHNLITVAGKSATCDSDGCSDYTRCTECNYSEGMVIYPATGHADEDGDGFCDNCNEDIDGSSNNTGCSCICHSSNWLIRIIYKIIRILWKIFNIRQACSCGGVHF